MESLSTFTSVLEKKKSAQWRKLPYDLSSFIQQDALF